MKMNQWKEQEVRFDSRREAQTNKGTRQANETHKEETSTARRVNRNLINLGMY